ncbi:MAG: phosphoglucosamine mutase [Cytophagales bacterium]|nr:MAG: phosphoglucosamine mutase [Cytophagales bacterium]
MSLIKSISGIRGTLGGKVGDALTPLDIVKFVSAYGTWVLETSKKEKVVIGRDARQSGEMVSNLVIGTLQGLGIDVINLDLATTPTVEIAVVAENAGGGIIISASHNPVQWNALKLLDENGEFISNEAGQFILDLATNERFEYAKVGALGKHHKNTTYLQKHIDLILALPLVDAEAIASQDFSIMVDGVNSVGGVAVPMLLKALGVKKIHELFCEPNGQFPHNPEPLPEHLSIICSEIAGGDYDLGIVVDPDVDRLAFICEDGSPFGEEYTLVAVADYVLQQKVGNTVSNLSSTRALKDVTLKRGGQYFAAAVGEVNVVRAMKENHAIVGGEGNGGIILPELHYGRDALVGIALFLTHLAKTKKSALMLKASYPSYHISKNKIELTHDIDVDYILAKVKERYQKQPINSIDGVKIEFDNEWVHLRKSNTEPIIRIYSESASQSTADFLAKKIIMDIKEIITEKE